MVGVVRGALHKLRHFFGNLRIRWKIFLTYLLLIGITLVFLSWTALDRLAKLEQYRYLEALEHTLQLLTADIENRISSVEEMSEVVVWRTEMREILSRDMENYDFSTQMRDMEALQNIMQVSINMESVGVKLYVKNPTVYSRERMHFFPLNESPYYEPYGELASAAAIPQWVAGSDGSLSCIRPVVHADRIFEEMGLLVFTMEMSLLEDLLESLRPTPGSYILLLDRENGLISSGKQVVAPEVLDMTANETTQMIIDGTAYRILQSEFPVRGWKVVAALTEQELKYPAAMVMRSHVPIILIVLAVALFFSVLLSASLTRRITRLAATMGEQEQLDECEELVAVSYRDEIGEMQSAYNQMIRRRRQLVDQMYKSEIREKRAEMKALQAQINPHFLYNTLDTINWMALEAGAKQASEMITLLADFFRMSLRSKGNIITVREEMEHARAYLQIQKYRMREALEFSIDIDEQILEMAAVKLTLQPLTENAILHGVQQSLGQSGKVLVRGRLVDGCIVLSVEDDGPGFEVRKPKSGFGTSSVDERIKMVFGEQYGLSCETPQGGGAKAVLTFPAQTVEQMERPLT